MAETANSDRKEDLNTGGEWKDLAQGPQDNGETSESGEKLKDLPPKRFFWRLYDKIREAFRRRRERGSELEEYNREDFGGVDIMGDDDPEGIGIREWQYGHNNREFTEAEDGDENKEESYIEYQLLHLAWDPKGFKDTLSLLPEWKQERVRFVNDNMDITEYCPSTGRRFGTKEAFALYADYQKYLEDTGEENLPKNRTEILLKMQEMLQYRMEEARKSGDNEQVEMCENAYNMLRDNEARGSEYEYCCMGDSIVTAGSITEFQEYVSDKIGREGANGTGEMIERGDPGGAAVVERTCVVLKMLSSHELAAGQKSIDGRTSTEEEPITSEMSIADVARDIYADGNTRAIDWDAVIKFSSRGRELYNHYQTLSMALNNQNLIKRERRLARGHERAITLLRSDTPTEELPADIQKMLELERPTEAQVAAGYRKEEALYRERASALLSDGELPPDLQEILDQSGRSREDLATDYATQAEEKANQAAHIEAGHLTSEEHKQVVSRPITREELANLHAQSLRGQEKSIARYNNNIDILEELFKRDSDSFEQEVLRGGVDINFDFPEGVADFLYREYGKDNETLLAFDIHEPGNEAQFTVKRLMSIYKQLEKRRDSLKRYSRYITNRYGTRIAINLDFPITEFFPSQSYDRDASYLEEQVMPAIKDAVIEISRKQGIVDPFTQEQVATRAKETEKRLAELMGKLQNRTISVVKEEQSEEQSEEELEAQAA